ncbi:MAG TPA: deoxynucleoside kinase [bacterium]|nr:deoxynucleoside kinase [bacterium]
MKRFVAVSGNIGSGKSTVTALLSEKLGWTPYYEVVDENPYLADFYGDMSRWSFHVQVFFLSKRFQHHQQIVRAAASIIQDRTIYEDAEIFARNLYLHGQMDERDFRSYYDLFTTMLQFLRPPDLILYLNASVPTLVHRIKTRARDFEQRIPAQYLAQLNERYAEWVEHFSLCPVVTIDADALALEELDGLVSEMQSRLGSLFPLVER